YGFMALLDIIRARLSARIGARVQARYDPVVAGIGLDQAVSGAPHNVMSGVRDVDAVQRLFAGPTFGAMLDLPWTPIFLAVIFVFHPLLGWLAIGGMVSLVLLAGGSHLATRSSRRRVIFKDIGQYSGKGNFEGWMKRVVVNTALRYLRKWKRPMVALEDYVEEGIIEQESYDSKLSLQELTQMIQQLPVGYRTVFNMYVLDGYTHKEISTYLNVSEGTSKSQLSKARKLLRTMLEQQLSH
ncbi:MAG: sigma-70 family RNA polymerase sigma factor, partial [Bacteroidota bacterium]